MSSLQLGIYIILNVAHCNRASLPSSDDKDHVTCRIPKEIVPIEQWEITPSARNPPNCQRYTIKNVKHGHYAAYTFNPARGTPVFGSRTERWWVITRIDTGQESFEKNAYSIACYDGQSDLSWTLMEGADETPIELHPFTKSQRSLWWIIPRSQPEVSSETSKPAAPHDRSTSQSLRTGAQETVANNDNVMSEWTRQPQYTALQTTKPVRSKTVDETVAPTQDHQIAGTGMRIPYHRSQSLRTGAQETVANNANGNTEWTRQSQSTALQPTRAVTPKPVDETVAPTQDHQIAGTGTRIPHGRSQSLRTGAQETVANNANGNTEWTRQSQSTALQPTRAVTPKPVDETVAPTQDHQIAGTGTRIPHGRSQSLRTGAQETVANNANVVSEWTRQTQPTTLQSIGAVTPKPVDQAVAPAQDHQIAGTGVRISHDTKTTKTTKAYEDVSVLSQTIRNVRANCLRIARDLIAFDSAEIRSTGGAVIQLGKEWQQYMKVFDDAVQYSQAQAVQVLVILRNMSSVFDEVEQGDRNDLRLELESFISQMKDKQDDVAGVVVRFNELDGISSMVRRVVQNFLDGDIGNSCQNVSPNTSRYEGRIRRHEMEKFRQDLGETKAAIADISFKTNFIVNIWQTINSDMRAIYTDARPKTEGNHMFTKLVVKKLSDTNNHLVWFLETYVEQVRAVDVE